MKRTPLKLFALLLCMLLLLTSCTQNVVPPAQEPETGPEEVTPPEEPVSTYTPGSYLGTGHGMFGEVVMEVTFSSDTITKISKISSNETVKVTEPAFRIMAERIIGHQSLAVDVVSCATYASKAILAAVEDAAIQANGDIKALTAPLLPAQPGEKIVKEADVLVIGGGGAGLSAGAAAAMEGAKVVLIEKNDFCGGNTVACGGVWNAPDAELAAQTDVVTGQIATLESFLSLKAADVGPFEKELETLKKQIKEYLSGDTSKMFDSQELYMIQTYTGGKRQDLDGNWYSGQYELIKTMCENSLDTRNWLRDMGAGFVDELSEPSGALWKRAIRPDDQINTYVSVPENTILKNGGEIMYGTTGYELILENGTVIGVKARMNDGTEVEVRAKSTVMAVGGFGSNIPMVIEYDNYWGNLDENIGYTTLPSTVGDGITMALKVGAALEGMEFTQLNKGYKTTNMHAAEGGLQAMFITTEGKRFVNEYAARDVFTRAAIENGGTYYCLTNEADAGDLSGIYDTYVFDTIEAMCDHFDMDVAVVTEEIEKYNSYVENGSDPEFGKNVFGNKIVGPYMIRVWVPIVHHTMGGIKINANTEVLDENGAVIPGFYAAGEAAGGLHGGNRLGGNAVADAFVFGRIAGINGAKYAGK